MISKLSICRYFWILFIVLFIGCEAPPTEEIPAAPLTRAPTLAATITPVSSLTLTSGTPTITPVKPTATSSLPVSSAPDELRMAYVIDGNLYFQDGSNPPLQLTNSGEDWRPLFFSEDGEKIFFLRGRISQDLYSINADGSQEQELVTNSLLLTFGREYDESTTPCDPVHVPYTSLLLFRSCSHPDEYTINHNSDLFIVDTDTNQIRNLLEQGQGGSFYVSPDGSMLAIDRRNSIDILGIDGRMIRRRLATYPLSEPFPLAALVYWVSDSRELVLALPTNTFYDTSLPPTYSIWRYSLDTGAGVQISLDPPPMSDSPIWVSPDGNWITYNNRDVGSFFLGDLRDGHTQSYEPKGFRYPHQWSPDSMHFVYEISQPGLSDLYLASVNASANFIGKGEFLGWLDASRYLYFSDKTFVLGKFSEEPKPILVGTTQPLFSSYPESFIFIYQSLSK